MQQTRKLAADFGVMNNPEKEIEMQPIIDALSAYGPGVVLFVIASVAIYKVFQGSIDGLKKSNEALGIANSRFESEIKDIRVELKERREEAQEEREQSKKYRAEVKELAVTVSSLENQLNEQNSLLKQLLENVANLSKEVNSVKEQHTSSVDRIDDIASSIANFTHHLEHSGSVDPDVIEFFEKKLNEHNLELIRLKGMVEGITPKAMSVHDAVVSVLDEDAEVVSVQDLEAVLHTMLDENED